MWTNSAIHVCPKCNGHSIAGPSYKREYGRETLNYVCLTCGYRMQTHTADARSQSFDDQVKTLRGLGQ